MNAQQVSERDPVAIQQELLALAEASKQIAEELTEATREYHEALGRLKVLQAKKGYVKQQTSALQSVLKSLGTF